MTTFTSSQPLKYPSLFSSLIPLTSSPRREGGGFLPSVLSTLYHCNSCVRNLMWPPGETTAFVIALGLRSSCDSPNSCHVAMACSGVVLVVSRSPLTVVVIQMGGGRRLTFPKTFHRSRLTRSSQSVENILILVPRPTC